ncbi:MAG: hypothetical protein ACAI44_21945 [Candidatus Sericytochromatia bacterium]
MSTVPARPVGTGPLPDPVVPVRPRPQTGPLTAERGPGQPPPLSKDPPAAKSEVELRNTTEAAFDPSDLPKSMREFTPAVLAKLKTSLPKELHGKLLVKDTLTNTSDEPELLGRTPNTGARVTIDPQGDAGGFLCSHVLRLNTEFRAQNPNLVSGFIHIPQHPQSNDQLSEVVGMGIRGIADQHRPEVTIMLTGFTHFEKITNNASGDFLFGDGTNDTADSFGFRPPHTDNINGMMRTQFGEPSQPPTDMVRNGQTVGRTYTYHQPDGTTRTINLAFVRLPVDEHFDNSSGPNNLPGDGTGDTLRSAYQTVRPDAILSLGVGVYGSNEQDRYEIEVNAPGYHEAHYSGDPQPNNSLGDIYRAAFPH